MTCTERGLQLQPEVVHVDFWEKFKILDLVVTIKKAVQILESGLVDFVWQAVLPANEIEDSFVEDFMTEVP